jgi:hypothetical protein
VVDVYQYTCVACDASETSSDLAYTRPCRSCDGTAFVHDEVYLESALGGWAREAHTAPAEAWTEARTELVRLSGLMQQAALRPDPGTWRAHARAHWRLLAWLHPVSDRRSLASAGDIGAFVAAQVQWWELLTFEAAVADPYRAYRRLAGVTPDAPSPGSIGHAAAIMDEARAFLEAALARWDHARLPLTSPSADVLRQAQLALLWWLVADSNPWLSRPQRKMLAMNHVTLDHAVSARVDELRGAGPEAVATPGEGTCPSCGSRDALVLVHGSFCPACVFAIADWVVQDGSFEEHAPDAFSLGDDDLLTASEDNLDTELDDAPGLGDAVGESVSLVMEFDADPSFDTEAGLDAFVGDSASIEVDIDDDPTTDDCAAVDEPVTTSASVILEIEDLAEESLEDSIIPGETDRYSVDELSDEMSSSFELVHDGPSGEATVDATPPEPESEPALESFDSPESVFDKVFDDSQDGEDGGTDKPKRKGLQGKPKGEK